MATRKTEKIVNNLINDLINLGQETSTITQFGKKWTFKLVSSEEYLNVLKKGADITDPDAKLFRLAMEILKYAIVEVEDIALDEQDKEILINGLNPSVVGSLYAEFEKIRAEKDNVLRELDASNNPKQTLIMKSDANTTETINA